MLESYDYFAKYDDEEFKVKKQNRNRKIDKRARAKEDFMKLNGRGLITDLLPLLAKRARKDKEK